MGVDDEAMVDSDGRVKAVRRMRIVDVSIIPRIVPANLSAAIMMMAEKLSGRILNKPALPPSKAACHKAA